MKRSAERYPQKEFFVELYKPSVTVKCTVAPRSRWAARGVSVFAIVLGVLVLASTSLAQRGGGGNGGGSHSSAGIGGHSSGGHFSATSASRGVGSRGVVSTRAMLGRTGARTGWMSNDRATGHSSEWGRSVWMGPEHRFGSRNRRHHRFPIGNGLSFFGFGQPFVGFWNNYSQDCEPLADGTLPPDCNVLGDWDGDAGGFSGDRAEYEDEGDANGQDADQEQPWVPTIYAAPPENAPERAPSPKPLTLLYLKNGSSYGVTNYWLAGERLHYVTSYGGENSVRADQVDLQRTVDENAGRGVPFVLKPTPR